MVLRKEIISSSDNFQYLITSSAKRINAFTALNCVRKTLISYYPFDLNLPQNNTREQIG